MITVTVAQIVLEERQVELTWRVLSQLACMDTFSREGLEALVPVGHLAVEVAGTVHRYLAVFGGEVVRVREEAVIRHYIASGQAATHREAQALMSQLLRRIVVLR